MNQIFMSLAHDRDRRIIFEILQNLDVIPPDTRPPSQMMPAVDEYNADDDDDNDSDFKADEAQDEDDDDDGGGEEDEEENAEAFQQLREHNANMREQSAIRREGVLNALDGPAPIAGGAVILPKNIAKNYREAAEILKADGELILSMPDMQDEWRLAPTEKHIQDIERQKRRRTDDDGEERSLRRRLEGVALESNEPREPRDIGAEEADGEQVRPPGLNGEEGEEDDDDDEEEVDTFARMIPLKKQIESVRFCYCCHYAPKADSEPDRRLREMLNRFNNQSVALACLLTADFYDANIRPFEEKQREWRAEVIFEHMTQHVPNLHFCLLQDNLRIQRALHLCDMNSRNIDLRTGMPAPWTTGQTQVFTQLIRLGQDTLGQLRRYQQ